MTRDRLRKAPVGKMLTHSDYTGMVFEEPKILHKTIEKYNFKHWIEHLYSFYGYASKQPPLYLFQDNIGLLRQIIAEGLYEANYSKQGSEIEKCTNEEELNALIIKQYTDEIKLYQEVNYLLRQCHKYQLSENVVLSSTLAPWILQLNTAIRREPCFEGKAYRGTILSEQDIELYKENELFVWASFVSASKSKDACLGGNVIFELFTESAMSLNDKRYARDISLLSVFPDEQEVLFPLACAFRVHYKKIIDGIITIGVATVDYN